MSTTISAGMVIVSAEELRHIVRGAVAEAVSMLQDSRENETLSFIDIKERWGVSRSTCLRMMREGNFPMPVDSGTREYRFRAADVEKAFAKKADAARKTRIRPDMRAGHRA